MALRNYDTYKLRITQARQGRIRQGGSHTQMCWTILYLLSEQVLCDVDNWFLLRKSIVFYVSVRYNDSRMPPV